MKEIIEKMQELLVLIESKPDEVRETILEISYDKYNFDWRERMRIQTRCLDETGLSLTGLTMEDMSTGDIRRRVTVAPHIEIIDIVGQKEVAANA